ncbi:Os12g0273300 [Oryza sativa Japonica Group]|uniref:Os12g0273300 protein n=2 Tax=Oryza sativa subsp. japonica TaxID=39947 RepID=Q0INZ1_ORYSJ|nr:Os12g0273300 [Oryza sativa Japonica Group]|eukprot:NP_001066555.1 Os12g0273300 [Oryza sativa Japonica Group]
MDVQVKDWRNKVRELSYDIEDCIDLFMHKLNRGDDKVNIVLKMAKKIRMLWSRHQIANQIQELKARVKEESDRRLRYYFSECNAHVDGTKIDPRLPALYVEEEKLVGIHGPMEEIIELLMKEDGSGQKLKVVSIVGFGGLGKTTLANQVYNKIKDQFDCSAFISVSQSPNIKKILFDMLKDVTSRDNSDDDKQIKVVGVKGDKSDDERQLIGKLRVFLENKRYFIIVDDIWSASAWEHVRLALPENSLCSRIITTTRNVNVAKSCCSGFQGSVYNIQPLNEQDSKKLFLKRLFHSDSNFPTHLEEVSHAIIKKCHGFPLAIICLASLLASKSDTKDQWEQVHNSLSSAFSSQGMSDILLLSYYDLPYHLKTCLLYLSVFPEDYKIDRDELIWRWIAEGFITEVKGQTLDQVGGSYFNELINRNMIQPIDIKYDGTANACRVHDMVLNLIISISSEENFLTVVDEQGYKYLGNKIRRLSFQSNSVENDVNVVQKIMDNLSQVRSLSFFEVPEKIPPFLKFHSLSVLVLVDYDFCLGNGHIKYLGSFFQLKYLRVTSYGITQLPDQFGNLHYLQTLDIRGSGIEKFPPTVVRLHNLARLLVGNKVQLPDGIGDLQSLQVLSSARLYKPLKLVEDLRRLTKLRTLEIVLHGSDTLGAHEMGRYEEALESSLTVLGKHKIQSLEISCCDYLRDKLLDLLCCTVPNIQKLVISGNCINRPSQQMLSLVNLAHLDIYFQRIKQEDLSVLGSISTLLYLRLKLHFVPDERLCISSQQFQSLMEFRFIYYEGGGLRMLFQQEAMAKLRRLQIRFRAEEMESNAGFEFSFHHLSSLEDLHATISCYRATRSSVEAAEAAIRNAASIHPGHLKVSIIREWESRMAGLRER